MPMIIIGHTFNGYPINSPIHQFPSWLNYLQIGLWGGMGFGIFLFLSGFGLFYTLSKKTNIDNHYLF